MKKSLVVVVMFAAALAAKNVPRNHTGELLSMESVPCGPMEPGALGNALLGAPPSAEVKEEKLCAEYILHAEGLYYRIRSKDRKHPVLLPIGEQAQFHLEKGHMLRRWKTSTRRCTSFRCWPSFRKTTPVAPRLHWPPERSCPNSGRSTGSPVPHYWSRFRRIRSPSAGGREKGNSQ